MTETVPPEAVELKQKGNKAFASHDWPGAVDFYTQAIEKYDKDASFYCNRAQVRDSLKCSHCPTDKAYRQISN